MRMVDSDGNEIEIGSDEKYKNKDKQRNLLDGEEGNKCPNCGRIGIHDDVLANGQLYCYTSLNICRVRTFMKGTLEEIHNND